MTADLRTMLLELADIGRPRLHRCTDGSWHCSVEFPAPDGVTAKVSSQFDHSTPEEALQTVLDRLGGLRDMLSVPTPSVGIAHNQVNQGDTP